MTKPAIDPRQKTGPVTPVHPIEGVPWDQVRERNKKLENRLDKRAAKLGWTITEKAKRDHFEHVVIQDSQRIVELVFWKNSPSLSHGTYYAGQPNHVTHIARLANQEQAERVLAGALCSCSGSTGYGWEEDYRLDRDCEVHRG